MACVEAMKPARTEDERQEHERRATDALIEAGESSNPWDSPIHAVDKALAFATAEDSGKLVRDMYRRNVVLIRARARNTLDPASPPSDFWWEKGPTPPGKDPPEPKME